eukprot:5586938-Lingulodinium_polyedra.AAC.1
MGVLAMSRWPDSLAEVGDTRVASAGSFSRIDAILANCGARTWVRPRVRDGASDWPRARPPRSRWTLRRRRRLPLRGAAASRSRAPA